MGMKKHRIANNTQYKTNQPVDQGYEQTKNPVGDCGPDR